MLGALSRSDTTNVELDHYQRASEHVLSQGGSEEEGMVAAAKALHTTENAAREARTARAMEAAALNDLCDEIRGEINRRSRVSLPRRSSDSLDGGEDKGGEGEPPLAEAKPAHEEQGTPDKTVRFQNRLGSSPMPTIESERGSAGESTPGSLMDSRGSAGRQVQVLDQVQEQAGAPGSLAFTVEESSRREAEAGTAAAEQPAADGDGDDEDRHSSNGSWQRSTSGFLPAFLRPSKLEAKKKNQDRFKLAVALNKKGDAQEAIQRAVLQNDAAKQPYIKSLSVLSLRLGLGSGTADPEQDRALRLALGYIMDARAGRSLRMERLDGWPYRLYVLSTLPPFVMFARLMAVAYCVIAFFECPAGEPANSTMLSVEAGMLLYWVALAAMTLYHTIDFGQRWAEFRNGEYRDGEGGLLRLSDLNKNFLAVVVLLLILDWLMACTLPQPVRVLRLFRPFLMLYAHRDTMSMFRTFVSTLPDALDLVWFLLAYIGVFSLLGVLAFREWEQATSASGGFSDTLSAVQTLWIFVCTNDNYPAIFEELSLWKKSEEYTTLEGKEELRINPKRVAILAYFVFNLMISIFFILAVVIALFYEAYKKQRKKQALRNRIRERQCLIAAFNMLDADQSHSISFAEFATFYQLLTVGTGTNQDEMVKQFRLIDQDGSGQIDVIEFFKLIDVLHFHYAKPTRLHLHSSFAIRRFCALTVTHPYFEPTKSLLTWMNVLVLVIALAMECPPETQMGLEMVCLAFLGLYLTDLTMQILGRCRYVRRVPSQRAKAGRAGALWCSAGNAPPPPPSFP